MFKLFIALIIIGSDYGLAKLLTMINNLTFLENFVFCTAMGLALEIADRILEKSK